jgi:folate-binding protein YgfZ
MLFSMRHKANFDTSKRGGRALHTIVDVDAAPPIELDGQYRALREEAGFLSRRRGTVLVSGPDAAEFLQGQLTNDIEALEADGGCYAALLDRKGHMQADMRVLLLSTGEIWMDTEPEAVDAVLGHLRMYSVGRQVEVEDASEAWTVTSLIGPAAVEAAGAGPLGGEHSQRHLEREGVEVLAVATDLGLDLITRGDQASEVRGALLESGAVAVSEEAAEILRVESGRPRFGREMSGATIPQEAGIEGRAVNFTKGCYIGQETVARLHYKGRPNRHLRGLRLEAPVADGDAVALETREVGRIGTAVISPAHGPIALAVIRREAEPGATVEVGADGVQAEIVEPPF